MVSRTPRQGTAKATPSVEKGSRTRGQHGPRRPRFQPASEDDFALVEAGVQRAADAAQTATLAAASSPADRTKALKEYGLKPSGKATTDRRLLLAAMRVRRDEAIRAAWAQGRTPPTIATQFDMTARNVQAILEEHRARRAAAPIPSSSELLHDTLEALEAQMERLLILASRSRISGPVIVGAIRTWREMAITRLELLQAMGLVSASPATDARMDRARDYCIAVIDELRARGVEQDVLSDVMSKVLGAEPDPQDGNVVTIESRAK